MTRSQSILAAVVAALKNNPALAGATGGRIATDLLHVQDEAMLPAIVVHDGGSVPITGDVPLSRWRYELRAVVSIAVRGDCLASDLAVLVPLVTSTLWNALSATGLGGAYQLEAPRTMGQPDAEEPSVYLAELEFPIRYDVPEGSL
jgi:hypothetical protein